MKNHGNELVQSVPAKTARYYINSAVSLTLMFGFAFLPTISPLTPLGMRVIGIFLGVVYAWSTVDIIWPALVGLVALGFLDGYTVPGVFMAGYGSNSFLFVLFILVFAVFVDVSGLSGVIANWMVSRKAARGRPWVLTLLLLTASYLIAIIVSVMPAIIICWNMLYKICRSFGYTKTDTYPKLMVIGIVFASLMGHSAMPFEVLSVMLVRMMTEQTGQTMNYVSFSILATVIGYSCILAYVGLCRFVFRPNVTPIAQKSFGVDMEMKLTAYQKQITGLLGLLFLLLFLPGILPDEAPFANFLNSIGNTGTVVLVIAFASFLKRADGGNFVDTVNAFRTGAPWESLFLMATAIPLSSAMTAEGTGIREAFLEMFGKILGAAVSPGMFLILLLAVSILLTNMIGNIVVGMIMMVIACNYAADVGISLPLLTVCLSVTCNMSILLPSGSPLAALLHSNHEWIDAKDIYRYGIPFILAAIAIVAVVSLTLGRLLF